MLGFVTKNPRIPGVPPGLWFWFPALPNVTTVLARLDAHAYLYKGRKFHLPQFLNRCIINCSFSGISFQRVERLSIGILKKNDQWCRQQFRLVENKTFNNFCPDVFLFFFPFLIKFNVAEKFYFHAYDSNFRSKTLFLAHQTRITMSLIPISYLANMVSYLNFVNLIHTQVFRPLRYVICTVLISQFSFMLNSNG